MNRRSGLIDPRMGEVERGDVYAQGDWVNQKVT